MDATQAGTALRFTMQFCSSVHPVGMHVHMLRIQTVVLKAILACKRLQALFMWMEISSLCLLSQKQKNLNVGP